jgi:copper resistance protein B
MSSRVLQCIATIAASFVVNVAVAQHANPHETDGMDMPAPATGTSSPPATSSVSMDDMPGMAMPPPAAKAATQPVPKDTSSNDHVAPPPPVHTMVPMSPAQITDVMQMDDQATRSMLLVDHLERTRRIDGAMATTWEADAWWGGEIDKLWLRSEGEKGEDGTRDARAELLWNHAFSTFWDWRLGVRDDFGSGPTRQWAALGVQGLAPYWFDLDATLYAGKQGRTAARLEASYDLRFTQRLILTPDLELNFYGKNDPNRDVHAGLSDGELGLRLRYEFSRRLAPYLGVNWSYRHDDQPLWPTPHRNEPTQELSWLLGVRFWL